MDPASVLSLVTAISQIIKVLYKVGTGIKDAAKEIDQLSSELFALKGAFEHVASNLEVRQDMSCQDLDADTAFTTPLLQTDDSAKMMAKANEIIRDLHRYLTPSGSSKFSGAMDQIRWVLRKDELQEYSRRLERIKSYFLLVTTSNNLEISRQILVQVATMGKILQDNQDHLVRDEQQRQRKTILFSSTIERTTNHLKHTEASAMAFFYCSIFDDASQELTNILGSLIEQLCQRHPRFWSIVHDKYIALTSKNASKRLDVEQSQHILLRIIRELDTVFLMIDAVNESKNPDQVVHVLSHLTSECINLRVLVSSTQDVQVNLPHPDYPYVVQMDSVSIQRDVDAYVVDALHQRERLRVLPDNLKAKMRMNLGRGASDSFRWVECQLQSLNEKKSVKELQLALQNVPRTLEQLYTSILLAIPDGDRRLVRRALFWLTFALRPLTLSELAEAIVIDRNGIDEDNRLLHPSDVIDACRSLLDFNALTQSVTLAHSSVRDFLVSDEIERGPVRFFRLPTDISESLCARLCLQYLQSAVFSYGYCETKQQFIDRKKHYPFFAYAAKSWPSYIRLMQKSGKMIDRHTRSVLLVFFQTSAHRKGGCFGSWVQEYHPQVDFSIAQSTPLYYAARQGMSDVVRLILEEFGTKDLETPGGFFLSTPVHVASFYGYTEVVRLLLQAGANPNEINREGERGVKWAQLYGYWDIVDLYVAAGLDTRILDGPFKVKVPGKQDTKPHLAVEGEGSDRVYQETESLRTALHDLRLPDLPPSQRPSPEPR
ncbi:putative ankyrin repeat protein [Phaeomoniella chlamydospora]|uniref:Putative ankyrin repeat protein n=1 Tax=Phaeomoniella chlamydospora TaxID=158046 RepID=A0A0G2E742_PHACM|nr:putative ankyrin repeat protein [Phaeomoniella chlamydospora]